MIYRDAFEEEKKINQLIEPEEKANVAFEILEMAQQNYEQFSINILRLYKRYHSTVPCLLKQVNKDNKIQFEMYFVMGLLYDNGKGKYLTNTESEKVG